MARLTKPLTDTEIKAAKPGEVDYTLHDGDGLQLLIKTNGKKVWQYRYLRPFSQKRAKLTFGPYPEVTLADARQRRRDARTLLTKNIDPYEFQLSQRKQALEVKANSFKVVAECWLQVKKSSITED